MEAKRGKKRALEPDLSQGDEGGLVGGMVGKARKGSQRQEEEEEEMVDGLARAVQGQGGGEGQGQVQGLARAALPTPPGKRMGKSRAASSGFLTNTTR